MGVAVALAGQLSIQHGGHRATEVALGVGQAQLVFAVLVKERARAIPRHELAEILWPGDLPATWGSALRSLVSKVRAFIAAAGLPPDAVVNMGGCYQLHLDDVVVDLEEAERSVGRAAEALAAGRSQDAVADAAAALHTLSFPVLPTVDNPWLDAWRDHSRDLAVRAGEIAAEAAIASGDAAAAVSTATDVVALAPYRESAFRLLMRAHEVSGQPGRGPPRLRAVPGDAGRGTRREPGPGTEALYIELLGTEPDDDRRARSRPRRLASTTFTFLFSDIEGSSAMWEQSPDVMSAVLARHDAALRDRGRAPRRSGVQAHRRRDVRGVHRPARDALAAAAVDAAARGRRRAARPHGRPHR